ISPGVAPAFQFVQRGDMPMAELGGFVRIQAPIDAQRHPAQDPFDLEVGRCGVCRIAAEYDERLHSAGENVVQQSREGALEIGGRRGYGVDMDDGPAEVAEL